MDPRRIFPIALVASLLLALLPGSAAASRDTVVANYGHCDKAERSEHRPNFIFDVGEVTIVTLLPGRRLPNLQQRPNAAAGFEDGFACAVIDGQRYVFDAGSDDNTGG